MVLWRATLCGLVLIGALDGHPEPLRCVCEVVDGPFIHWSDRGVIFEGTALTVDPSTMGAHPERVLFVVDAVWRGPVYDTATLVIEASATCLAFTAGRRYLVTADLVDAKPVARNCSPSFVKRHAEAHGHFVRLGPPSARRGTVGTNSIDEAVIPIGTSPPVAQEEIRVAIGTDDRDLLNRVLISDVVWSPGAGGLPSFSLRRGLYRVRIEWVDGRILESYLAVRCDERVRGDCTAFRYITDR